MKLAGQVQNGGDQTNQKSNGPSSSSDHEDNAALEEWAATRIQNAFRKYKVTWIMDDILHYHGIDYWIQTFYKRIVTLF